MENKYTRRIFEIVREFYGKFLNRVLETVRFGNGTKITTTTTTRRGIATTVGINSQILRNYIKPNQFNIKSSMGRKVNNEIPEEIEGLYRVEAGYGYCPSKKRGGKIDTGEDAFFLTENIRNEENGHYVSAFGVSDGVGGWARMGIDPSAFSRSLMKNAAKVAEENTTLEPKEILNQSYQRVVESGRVKAGSATACVSMFDHQTGKLKVANLGDSGFMVFREQADGKFRQVQSSSEQTHFFNCPFQIAIVPKNSNSYSDSPEKADEYTLNLIPGDIVVVATDGLLDNVFAQDIAQHLNRETTCTTMATTLVEHAKGVATNTIRQNETPFAVAARQSGYTWKGGKDDDIVCIVVRVSDVMDTTPIESPKQSI
mmetsp:Transcript_9749/g.14378  ORF Transcript_9749/g.14378 Transcript_9749/m.14378 type:complete len:371 (+) Transcript_9749:65-1177(+)